MRFIFIDEFDGVVNKKIFGIGLISTDATKYRFVCDEFGKILRLNGWDIKEEFKGSYLFSRNPAGQLKTPEQMIELTKKLISFFAGNKNTRGGLISFFNTKGRGPKNYRDLVCSAINKLPKNNTRGIKSLVSVYFDRWDEILSLDEKMMLDRDVTACLVKRGYLLVENVTQPVESSNKTPGVIYADILSHLSRWVVENPKSKELNLFDLIQEKPTTKKKIIVAHEIFNLLKKGVIYRTS